VVDKANAESYNSFEINVLTFVFDATGIFRAIGRYCC